MQVTKATGVTLVGFVLSGLLPVLAADCSFQKRAKKTSVQRQAQKDYYRDSSESFVANSFCLACHLDFEEEKLVLSHKLAGIGCERCHGESVRHRSDEANITPPEIMYTKARINPTCMMCHPRDQIKHVSDHQPVLAGALTIFDQETKNAAVDTRKYCTDCHGKSHHIKARTVRWNKATGELIAPE